MYNWPPKDPNSNLPYSVDWSRFLDTSTISSVTWYCYNEGGVLTAFPQGVTVNGLTSGVQSNSSTVTTIQLSAGTVGVTYRIVCRITFDTSNMSERTLRLNVREL